MVGGETQGTPCSHFASSSPTATTQNVLYLRTSLDFDEGFGMDMRSEDGDGSVREDRECMFPVT